MKNQSARIVSIAAACVAGWTLSALGTTYYADFKGTKSQYAYDWYNVDNWWVKDANDQNVRPTQVPQEGDDVIVNSGCGQMSAWPDGSMMNALNSITFNAAPSPMHQGYVGLLANGDGIKVMPNVAYSTYAGIRVKGSGDLLLDIGSGGLYSNQKGVARYNSNDQVTLIKKGAGTFRPVVENNSAYCPVRTILMGGTFELYNAAVPAGHELVFGSDDGNIRLKMLRVYKAGSYETYREFSLNNGALIESNEVNNTTHGFTSDDNAHGFYVRITGTPKLAEQRFTGSLYNTAGIAFCPGAKQAGGADYLFTIAKVANPDRQQGHGRLAVTNGTLRLAEGATFRKLQKLNVGPTGTFKIESGSGADAFTLELDVAAGGTLDLASGVTLNSQKTKIGGETLAAGTYTAANCTAITGGGTLVVTAYSSLNPIVLDVPQDMYIESALAAYNAANDENVSIETLNGGVDKERPLVKLGAGELGMDKPMSSYIGSVYVEEGSLYTYVRYSIGQEGNDNAPVYVRSGATFKTASTSNDVMNANRIFHIAGNGMANVGALNCGSTFSGNYGNAGCFGKKVILDDDATANVGNWMYMGSSRLELNGHTLTFKLQASENTDRPAHLPPTIAGPGEIFVKGGQWRNPGTITFEGSGKVTFDGDGGFRMTGGATPFAGTYNNWTFEFNGPARNIFYCDYNISPRDSKGNSLFKSIVVNSTLALWNQGDRNRNYLQVKAPISGMGGISTGDARTSFLHLLNPSQTYTGGITFNQGVIWAYPDGAIPAGEGAGDVTLKPSTVPLKTTNNEPTGFTNTFNGVAFMCPVTYHLPSVQSTGAYPARIQNGQGSWKTVTQNGTGGLEYFSSLNADKLDVKKGAVKLGRGMMAGLWEGTNLYASAAAATTAYEGEVCFTNLAVRGPTSAIKEPGFNYTTWQPKELITYTGYIWNRGSETVTWSIASALTGSVTVKVDGQVVISGANQILHGNVTLTPGPHAFEYRACSGDAAAAPITSNWTHKHGFAIDKQGRNTANAADYVMGVDTGDGALFTRTTEAALPQFGEMAFATNTTFDVNGNAFVADKVTVTTGGSVASTANDAFSEPSFTVNGRFEVDGSGAVGPLVSAVPLTFGPDCVFSATNLASLAHGTYTIAKTTGDAAFTLQGALAKSRISKDSKDWQIYLSADGKSLELVYSAGTMLIVR